MPIDRQQEVTRKAFHVAGIILIPIGRLDPLLVPGLLILLVICYYAEEILAQQDRPVPGLSSLIRQAKRSDRKTRIDTGAFWLAAGVGLPYLFFPRPVAEIALLLVCVADAAASLGPLYSPELILKRLPHSQQKSWIGSAYFFVTAFACSVFYVSVGRALIIAAVGTVLESLPPRDIDNLTVPLGVAIFIGLMGWF